MHAKLIAFNMITLNGYYRGANHELDWHQTDEAFHDFVVTQLNEAGCLLMGSTTYNLMADYWQAEHTLISDPVVAEKMNGYPKYVVTTNPALLKPWINAHPVSGDTLVETIQYLKTQQHKPVLLLGSGMLLNTLLSLSLVDEVRMMLNPVSLSGGDPLLSPASKQVYKLTDIKPFDSGNLLLCYQPV